MSEVQRLPADVDEALEWLSTDIYCALRTGARPRNVDYERWLKAVGEVRTAWADHRHDRARKRRRASTVAA